MREVFRWRAGPNRAVTVVVGTVRRAALPVARR